MRAIVQEEYGPHREVLHLREIRQPVAGPGQVLVRVRATSVHADVWHAVTGVPFALRVMGSGLRGPEAAGSRHRPGRGGGPGGFGCDPVRAGRSCVRRGHVEQPMEQRGHLRRVRGCGRGAARTHPGEPLVRGGCGRPDRRPHRADEPARPGSCPGRPARARERRRRRGRGVGGAAGQGLRRRGDGGRRASRSSTCCATSAPTTSSTTPSGTSRGWGCATTSCSTSCRRRGSPRSGERWSPTAPSCWSATTSTAGRDTASSAASDGCCRSSRSPPSSSSSQVSGRALP